MVAIKSRPRPVALVMNMLRKAALSQPPISRAKPATMSTAWVCHPLRMPYHEGYHRKCQDDFKHHANTFA